MKTLFITGANSAISAEYVKKYEQSYECIITHYAHRHDRIDNLIELYGNKIIPICADLSCRNDVETLSKTLEKFEIDEVLHLAAPALRHQRFTKCKLTDFELEMQVVYWSFVRLCQGILSGMIKRGHGHILGVLTEYTITNQPAYLSHYISAKFALLGLLKSLASEYGMKGIQVNGISPGMINTDFIANLPQYIIDENAKVMSKGRILCPDDLLPTIHYLLSEESVSICGQNILLR